MYRNRTPVTAEDIRRIVSGQVESGGLELWDGTGMLVTGSSAQVLRRLQRQDGPSHRVMSPKQLKLFSLP